MNLLEFATVIGCIEGPAADPAGKAKRGKVSLVRRERDGKEKSRLSPRLPYVLMPPRKDQQWAAEGEEEELQKKRGWLELFEVL